MTSEITKQEVEELASPHKTTADIAQQGLTNMAEGAETLAAAQDTAAIGTAAAMMARQSAISVFRNP